MERYARGVTIDSIDCNQADDLMDDINDLFLAFINSGQFISWMKDERGRIVYLNKTHEKRFGVRIEDWLGKTDFEIWPKEIAEQFWMNDQQILDNGHVTELIEEAKNPDGTSCFWWNIKFPFQDSLGKRYVGGVGIDITESKKTEQALSESIDTLNSFYNSSPFRMAILEMRDGQIITISANMTTAKSQKVSPEDFSHRTRDDLKIPSDVDLLWVEKLLQCERDGGSLRFEYLYPSAKGDEWHKAVVSLIGEKASGYPRFSFIVEDITEHKKTADELNRYRLHLEDLVKEKTAMIERTCNKLKHENELREKTETVLRKRESELAKERSVLKEVNAALNVALRQREDEKAKSKKDIASEIKSSLLPYIEKLESTKLSKTQKESISQIKSHLDDITSIIRKYI
jgi:PAS domain S-box-containing protein